MRLSFIMKLAIYQVMHVGSLLMLASFLFMAFANPDPSGRRKTLMWTGIFAAHARWRFWHADMEGLDLGCTADRRCHGLLKDKF